MSTRPAALKRVLIANRGEIAVRIARTCSEMDIESVAVYSDADAGALHVRAATTAVRLPGTSPADTYLNIVALIRAAEETGVDAVHPGYGFLSENPSFAQAVTEAGLTFIGPSAEAIATLGDKERARAAALAAGLPVVPGLSGTGLTADEVLRFAHEHGWPIAVKATHGGGGRGIRVMRGAEDVEAALISARAEARAAFGSDAVFVERYLESPRHIEVQVIADAHGNIAWLSERDCSVQRRFQKLIEEAPAGLEHVTSTALGEAAVQLTRYVGYQGAGTVEFLYKNGDFYFLEMNTRIQVEHPVTEQVLGLDLIREQIRIGSNETLSVGPAHLTPRGHAVECRINAEDARLGFLPAPGRITALEVPLRPGVRFDTGYEPGDTVPPCYDSLIGKLIVWGPTREVALRRTAEALASMRIDGVPTTIDALRVILSHADFRSAPVTTDWFARFEDAELGEALGTSFAGGSPTAAAPAGVGTEDIIVNGRAHRIPVKPSRTRASRSAVADRRRESPPRGRSGATASGSIRSPMQGTVVNIAVVPDEVVAAGKVLATMEAMKMQIDIKTPVAGRVTQIQVEPGVAIPGGTLMFEIEADGA